MDEISWRSEPVTSPLNESPHPTVEVNSIQVHSTASLSTNEGGTRFQIRFCTIIFCSYLVFRKTDKLALTDIINF